MLRTYFLDLVTVLTCSFISQGLDIVPTFPPEVTSIEKATLYNDYCHRDAVWQTLEKVSGFLDYIPNGEELKDQVMQIDDTMKVIGLQASQQVCCVHALLCPWPLCVHALFKPYPFAFAGD